MHLKIAISCLNVYSVWIILKCCILIYFLGTYMEEKQYLRPPSQASCWSLCCSWVSRSCSLKDAGDSLFFFISVYIININIYIYINIDIFNAMVYTTLHFWLLSITDMFFFWIWAYWEYRKHADSSQEHREVLTENSQSTPEPAKIKASKHKSPIICTSFDAGALKLRGITFLCHICARARSKMFKTQCFCLPKHGQHRSAQQEKLRESDEPKLPSCQIPMNQTVRSAGPRVKVTNSARE